MHIAIFTNNYLPNPFGVAGSIESFRKELEKLGHTVYIFAPEFRGYVDENSNACPSDRRVFRYPSIDLKFKDIHFPIAIPYSRRMDEILEKLEVDVIHAQHPNLLGWAAKKWAEKKNVPLAFTWHTLYDQYTHFVPFFVPEKLSMWWTIRNAVNYANSADQIVIPTESVREIIQKWGVTNKNIIAIPTGVEKDLLVHADRASARHEYEIADDEVVLTLVCRMTAEKNVLFLAKTVASILEKNEKVLFVLAGDGSELEAVKKILSNEKIGNRFRCFGIVDAEQKAEIYALSDIFVYASKSETQGMVLTEAMYAGLPIVGVHATGVSDIVRDGETGLLVSENENEFIAAVQKLVDDKNLRQSFGENGKKIALENYTSEVCAQKILDVYEKVISRNKTK